MVRIDSGHAVTGILASDEPAMIWQRRETFAHATLGVEVAG